MWCRASVLARVTFNFSHMSQPPWPLLSSSEKRGAASRSNSAAARHPLTDATDDTIPIIAFCHLGWDWVWQRPQQFLSRLAQRHRVLFVETYCSDVDAARVDLRTPDGYPSLTVCQTHLPRSRWHDGKFIDQERRRILKETLNRELRGQFERPLLWFYDPMAVVAFARQLGEQAIVYDCMDELSQFKGAPPALIERERELLAVADVVFCGGQKMRKKRLPLNSNTHFFGTGVDVKHFGKALTREQKIAPEIAAFGNAPVLGYFGVVDERIDYELLAKLADARPDWQVVMVGPVCKVDPADFPKRPNLHFIGGRPYAELPALTKGFSVAMMPFALNAATEYINPTKALEYMAAGRPVVSTALDEVRMNFGSIARIAESHAEFIAFCAKEAEKPSRARIVRGMKLAADNTWEAIIAKMEKHLADVLTTRSTARAKAAAASTLNAGKLPRLVYV
jgi:glycosyltransferase involved in cell wall biosynthesis